MKINVGVIFGGRTVENEISIISAIQCIEAMNKDKYNVIPIYISKNGTWYTGKKLMKIENYKDLDKLILKSKKILLSPNANEHIIFKYFQPFFSKRYIDKIDVAFPVVHGTHVEDGSLQGFLELMNIPYVGPNVISSAIGMDKNVQKMIFKAYDIPVLDCINFYSSQWINEQQKIIEQIENTFPYPVVVKPSNLGSSVGISKVRNREELIDAIDLSSNLARQTTVEKMIENLMEINCSVLGDYEFTEASVCEEIINSNKVFSFEDKYISGDKTKGISGTTKRKIPADITEEISKKIQELAKKAFIALDLSGVTRFDFLIDKDSKKIYLNEPNTIPGSLAFYLWEASGIHFTTLIDRLIELALKKSREKNNLVFHYESNILSGFNLKSGIKGKKISQTK